MIIDAHLHCSGEKTTDDLLRTMDGAGVDLAVLLAPFLTPPYSLHDAESLGAGNAHLAALVAGHEDRLIGLAVVNPLHDSAADDLARALERPGIRGLKTVPTGWYPYDARAHRVYEIAARADAPCLFHIGIFIDGKSGRYCRPSYFEAIREHPRLRATLAHLCWPWCDEAIVVGLIDLLHGRAAHERQFRFDLSFGPPVPYRHRVFGDALGVLGSSMLQYGSDAFLPCDAARLRRGIEETQSVLDAIGASAEDRANIFHHTASVWL
jgi:predicted TIM-barrel fold metal-dependent hydrolase